MSNFKNINDIKTLEKATDATNILVENNGKLEKTFFSNVIGSGSIPTAIIKSEEFDNALGGVATAGAAAEEYYICENFTLNEALNMFKKGEPFKVVVKYISDGHPTFEKVGSIIYSGNLLILETRFKGDLYWTENGISNALSGGPK